VFIFPLSGDVDRGKQTLSATQQTYNTKLLKRTQIEVPAVSPANGRIVTFHLPAFTRQCLVAGLPANGKYISLCALCLCGEIFILLD
jgi:hypothetical protein